MCFNAKTSLFTFSISLMCSYYLFNRGLTTNNKNDIFVSIITISIGLMQFIEYFLWRNQNCNNINHYFSLLIILLLFLQGIVANLSYIYLYPNDDYFFSRNFVNSVMLTFLIFVVYLLSHLNKYNLCSKPSATSCRLLWDSYIKLNYPENRSLYILFNFFYFFMFLIPFINSICSKNKLFTKYPLRYSFLLITFIISVIYVVITSKFYKEINTFMQNGNFSNFSKKLFLLSSNDVFGSLWCFLCVFVGIVGILKI